MSTKTECPQFTEGTVSFVHGGETLHTYYKVYGQLEGRIHSPLVVLHGGPGLVHDYLFPFVDLADEYEIPVVLYDQLGNGKSSHIEGKEPAFWTIDLFIDELVNLLSHLSIEDSFDLLGHSWGGILAAEFAARRHPGLHRLVISNSVASPSLRQRSNAQLLEGFPEEVKIGIAEGMKNPPAYIRAVKEFHSVHGCLTRPLPGEYWYALDQIFGPDGDLTVASAPALQRSSIIDRLHLIQVPTLVINGRNDFVQDFTVQPFLDKIPNVKWVTFENSSHTPFIEERSRYMKLLSNFLSA
ncbi:hypothetical protein M413DRAFT_123779 [Hebeloma cylindrosporum]|uniref:AB hydrolase-1 domain-containing protein n=1 Tax=Hebeloma cylindrosporum TaxID=76867 RepID=A0A0C2XYU2_HEBCY|nr:hypothetical protein M413DRAFT_123779 [Hebeloma cylindrosporum h7]